ncbi:DMT family transporter [candidate division KSB1 bacterium]|nr:MAG: DMT family transporter [candidate division KSB1 bacterium]
MLAAYLALFALTVIWGITFPLVQGALSYASPLVFLALRFGLASLLFPLLVWPRAFHLSREVVWKGVWLGVLLWGGYGLQTFGLAHTTAARSGFLTGTLVPLTPLFAWILFRAHIGWRAILAVALAFVGTAIMSGPQEGGLNLGDILTLFCAVSYALQINFVNRWASRENEVQLTWIQIAVTSLLCLSTLPLEGPRLVFSPYLIWAVAITAVFATVFGIWGQLRFQPRISSTAAAIIYAFEPVFAGLAAWVILGSVPTAVTLIGAGFIFIGMLLSSTAPAEIKPHVP